jgi:hypothetical protein
MYINIYHKLDIWITVRKHYAKAVTPEIHF